MIPFRIEKQNQKTCDEKISIKNSQNIPASINSSSRFCGVLLWKIVGQHVTGVKTLKQSEQSQAIRDILQNWIN